MTTGLENLIELIRTTNEIYFITAPQRLRAAYILVDDIAELALKTYLQSHAVQERAECLTQLKNIGVVKTPAHQRRLGEYFNETITFEDLTKRIGLNGEEAINQVQTILDSYSYLDHWSINHPQRMVTLDAVLDEVRDLQNANPAVITLLDHIEERHNERNVLYHNHQRAGWEIGDQRCLQAMQDLFDLMEHLFPCFLNVLQQPQHNTVRCQIGVLRLKLQAANGQQELIQPYNDALEQMKRNHRYDINQRAIEHSILHNVSVAFFTSLQEQFRDEIARLETRVLKLEEMLLHRNRRDHRMELAEKQRLLALYQEEFQRIQTFLQP